MKQTWTLAEVQALVASTVASLCLCDHLGDVLEDAWELMKQVGYEYPARAGWEELHDLFARRKVRTLYDTPLSLDSEEP